MATNEIDNLVIKVSTKADKTSASFKSLVQDLKNLNSTLNGNSTSLVKGFKELSDGLKNLNKSVNNSTINRIHNLATALTYLTKVNGDLVSTSEAINKITNSVNNLRANNLRKGTIKISNETNNDSGSRMGNSIGLMTLATGSLIDNMTTLKSVEKEVTTQSMFGFENLKNAIKSASIEVKDYTDSIKNTKNVLVSSSEDGTIASQFKVAKEAIQACADEYKRLKNEGKGGLGLEIQGLKLKNLFKKLGVEIDITNDKTKALNETVNKGTSFWTKMISAAIKIRLVGRYIGAAYKEAADYIETRNLFHITFSGNQNEKTAIEEDMENWAMEIHDKLHVAEKDLKNFSSVYNAVIKTLDLQGRFGEENIKNMSKNLTQLTLDFASQRNLSFDDAFYKIRAGIVGTLQPLGKIGVALNEASMQEWVYNQGINMTVRNLSSADKAYIRYRVLLDMISNSQQDLAQTMWTPANLIRIITSELHDLARTLGYIVVMIGTYLLPMIKLAVEGLTLLAEKLAKGLGFNIEDFAQAFGEGDNDVEDYFDDATESIEDATKAMKDYTLGFDELHTLSNSSNGKNGGDSLHLPYYEFPDVYDLYGDLENNENYQKMETAFQKIKEWADEVGQSTGFRILLDTLKAILGVFKEIGEWAIENPEAFGDALAIGGVVLAIEGLIKMVLLLKAGFLAVRDAINAVKNAYLFLKANFKTISTIAGWILLLVGAWLLVTDTIKICKGEFSDWGDGAKVIIRDVGLALVGLGAVMGSAIIGAVGAIAIAVSYFWDYLVSYTASALSGLAFLIETFVTLIIDGLGKSILAGLGRIGDDIAYWLTNALSTIGHTISVWWNNLKEFLGFSDVKSETQKQLEESIYQSNKSAAKQKHLDTQNDWQSFAMEGWDEVVDQVVNGGKASNYLRDNADYYRQKWKSEHGGGEDNETNKLLEELKEYTKISTEETKTDNTDNRLKLSEQTEELKKQLNTMDQEKELTYENNTLSSLGNDIAAETEQLNLQANAMAETGWNRLHTQISNLWFKLDAVQKACENIRMQVIHNHYYGAEERAVGGFVDTGNLFIANEAGPELVGNIGNKTAVANQGQMVDAIASGVYESMMSALSKQSNRPIEVTSNLICDERVLASAVERGKINNGFNTGLGAFGV